MSTYKQDIKEKSRKELWTRSVRKLTTKRNKCRILSSSYIKKLWDYSFKNILTKTKPNKLFIKSWCNYSNGLYKTKRPSDLKIAYFCGPEPENDLEIMIDLGIKIENVWAIESNIKIYDTALSRVRNLYPTLKVFHGSINELMKVTPTKFDIIYLDFTGSLFSKESKPLLTINAVFENQSLSDLGILIINSTLPDKIDDNIEFLSGYFRSHPFLEQSIFTGKIEDSDYYEGADCNGLCDNSEFKQLIEKNFECAYSAFSTHYPSMFASYIQPMNRVSNSKTLRQIFFNNDDSIIKNAIEKMAKIDEYDFEETDTLENLENLENLEKILNTADIELINEFESNIDYSGSELYEQHENFPIWHFINSLKESNTNLGKYWHQQFNNKNSGTSYFDSVKLYDLLRNANYSYQATLSSSLSDSISKITDAIPDKNGGVFCDVPLPHLWVELALNQLGSSYHMNTDQHWRARYTAKTRTMYLDMFVFDKCRALYDWIPMINLYGEDLVSIERQIIIRSCMDAITKQNHHSAYYSYYGANLIGIHEKKWAKFGELSGRREINV